MIAVGPFDELDLRDELRLQPATMGHLLLRQTLAEGTGEGFRQVPERAFLDLEPAEPPEDLRTQGWREPASGSCDVDQPIAFVDADDEGVERGRPERVAANDELLAMI